MNADARFLTVRKLYSYIATQLKYLGKYDKVYMYGETEITQPCIIVNLIPATQSSYTGKEKRLKTILIDIIYKNNGDLLDLMDNQDIIEAIFKEVDCKEYGKMIPYRVSSNLIPIDLNSVQKELRFTFNLEYSDVMTFIKPDDYVDPVPLENLHCGLKIGDDEEWQVN